MGYDPTIRDMEALDLSRSTGVLSSPSPATPLSPSRSLAHHLRYAKTPKTGLGVSAAIAVLLLLAFFQSGSQRTIQRDHCLLCGPHDDLCSKWGSSVLTRSRAYEGSGVQLEGFLRKVREGQHVRIGIIGGSISACIDSREEDCYVRRLERDLRSEFVQYGSTLEVVSGAISAVGSDFFSACWHSQFIEEPDLMIVELAVNDISEGKENRNMDALLRSLFERPSRPSILLFNMWSPLQVWSNGSPSIESLAQYYDLPVISHRAVMYHQRRLHTSPEEIYRWFSPGLEGFWPGGHHPAPLGHELSADLLRSFIREKLCAPVHRVTGQVELDLPDTFSPWNPYQELTEEPHPMRATSKCYGPQPGALHFPITKSPSRQYLAHPFVEANWKSKHFLAGYKPGDRAEFDVEVTQGFVAIMYWRSASLGLGRAWIWLDGEEDRRIWLWGDWGDNGNKNNVPVRHDIPTNSPPGKRKFFVEISAESRAPGEHEFRISAIIT